jgi:hypothetical protein
MMSMVLCNGLGAAGHIRVAGHLRVMGLLSGRLSDAAWLHDLMVELGA